MHSTSWSRLLVIFYNLASGNQLIKKFPPLTESRFSLKCPQRTVTGPYPEPAEPSPLPHTIILTSTFNSP